jgi:hypothetical protein
MEIKLTFNLLPVIAVLLSVLAWMIPGFKKWFEALASQKKQLFMIGILVGCDLVAILLSVFGFLQIYTGPTWREWVWYPIVDITIALMTNAGVYKATNYLPPPNLNHRK